MKPNEGQVWLHNTLVTSPRPTVGMAFQNPVLLEWRTILQNVLPAARDREIAPCPRRRRPSARITCSTSWA